jgi:hypothetical protein
MPTAITCAAFGPFFDTSPIVGGLVAHALIFGTDEVQQHFVLLLY